MSELSLQDVTVKRRRYSKDFKRKIVSACIEPQASVPKIAMMHGLNANLVHRWIRQSGLKNLPSVPAAFVALPMTAAQARLSPVPAKAIDAEAIRIEIPYRHQLLSISWPASQADRCMALLRELLQ